MSEDRVQLPFWAAPMSAEAEELFEQDKERYEHIQVEILVASAHPGRLYAAYENGWHMRVGRN